MKNKLSLWALLVVVFAYATCRVLYTDSSAKLPIQVTTWDALGYYLYLPSTHIYHDDTSFTWFTSIDQKYQLSGGEFYQATPHPNGHLVYKYLRGVSILQSPFYYLAHVYCLATHQYPADGFSYPYQWAIAWGALLYFFISLVVLRWILLRFAEDRVVAIVLLLLTLATNAIQYVAVEGGQSHAYIFPLYVLILYLTYKWHQSFHRIYSFAIGLCIGLATISRPTEAVMLFIPLLWGISDKAIWAKKWQTIRTQYTQWIFVLAGGLLGIAPQLVYWKRVTGSWIYDVGSKWDFLNPHFRVLFGPEKGWFIYTPVTLLFVIGLFFLRQKTYRVAVITFCLANIYIIISWHIWRYGGSYSTRALVQSYPVFALPLAGLISYILDQKWRWILLPLSVYLIGVNGFQIYQYNRNILHYDDMNFAYYKAIYLNPNPTAREMSLLDTQDYLANETDFTSSQLRNFSSSAPLVNESFSDTIQLDTRYKQNYLKADLTLHTNQIWGRKIYLHVYEGDRLIKLNQVRLYHPLAKDNSENKYLFYTFIPDSLSKVRYTLHWDSTADSKPEAYQLNLQLLSN